MTILGAPTSNYHLKFLFRVEIDNIAVGSFKSCSELSSEFAEVTQWEGGSMIPDKQPGRMTFDDVTLERGVTGDNSLYLWHSQVGDAAANTGNVEPQFKRTLDIVQLNRQGNTIRRHRLFGAWPKRFVAGDWDNDSDENVMESIVLAYDYYRKVLG